MQFPRRTLVSSGLGLILGASMMAGAAGLAAQDTTQTTGTDDSTPARPAHIHNGTCASLGDVVAPLNDLSLDGMSSGGLGVAGVGETNTGGDTLSTPGADTVTDTAVGGDTATDTEADATDSDAMVISAEYSFSTVPMSIDEILSGDHAINVHESDENMSLYIACGDLGGSVDQNGSLVIGLRELNDSGYAGIAVLSPSGSVDGNTDVSVFIANGLMGFDAQTSETPGVVATPAGVAGTPDVDTGVVATPGAGDGTAEPGEVPTEPSDGTTDTDATDTADVTDATDTTDATDAIDATDATDATDTDATDTGTDATDVDDASDTGTDATDVDDASDTGTDATDTDATDTGADTTDTDANDTGTDGDTDTGGDTGTDAGESDSGSGA